jgi:hypothetical protein
MKNSHKIGNTEITVSSHTMSGSQIFVLEIQSRSSLDYASIVLNMTEKEYKDLAEFFKNAN